MSENPSNPQNKPESSNVFWFYKWPIWGRVLAILILPYFFIVVALWPKLKTQISKIVAICVSVIICFFIFGNKSSIDSKNLSLDPKMELIGIEEVNQLKSDKVEFKVKIFPYTADLFMDKDMQIWNSSLDSKTNTKIFTINKNLPEGETKINLQLKNGTKIVDKTLKLNVDLTEKKAQEEASKSAQQVKEVEESKKKDDEIKAKVEKDFSDRKKAKIINNVWDGGVGAVSDYLKRNLDDPDCYQSVKWFPVITKAENEFYVRHTFRACNGFGAKILNNWVFYFNSDGVITDVEKD